MVTFVCVWVRGNVPYSAEYVLQLKRAVERHYPRVHRFVCLTDAHPHELPGVEVIKIKPVQGIAGWWSKIELFNKKHEICGRVVYLDLDVLIVNSLQPIVEYPAEFALVPHGGTFTGRGGLKVIPRYNSSVMVWDVSPRMHKLFDLWTINAPRRLWGDQDYIGEMFTGEETMPPEWFPRLSELTREAYHVCASGEEAHRQLLEEGAVVVLSKKPKNVDAADQFRWFHDLWRAV